MAPTFSYTQAWVSEGGSNSQMLAKKAVFLVLSGKKQISPLLAPLEKLLEKSTSALMDKNPSDVHAQKHVKLHYFCKKMCCIKASGNTVQQRQCGKHYASHSRLTDCERCIHSAEHLRNPAKLQVILIKYCRNSATFFSIKNLL